MKAGPRIGQRGLAYVEVLIASALVAIAVVPAIDALRTGLVGTRIASDETVDVHRVESRMTEVLAESFAVLDAAALAAGGFAVASTYSDGAGSPGRLLVFLSRYDADDADGDGNPFTGTDEGLLWVRVQVEGSAHGIETLVADPG